MSKIYKAPVVKQAAEKADNMGLPLELQDKTDLSKEAGIWDAVTSPAAKEMAMRAGKTMALSGATVLGGVAATGLANMAAQGIGHMIDKPKFEAAFKKAIEMDPKLQSHNPADLHRYAELIMEASPSVAMNPLLLSNYLRYLTDYQGSMNLTGYRELANLEGQILNNKEKSKPVTGIAQKALLENTIKSIAGNNRN